MKFNWMAVLILLLLISSSLFAGGSSKNDEHSVIESLPVHSLSDEPISQRVQQEATEQYQNEEGNQMEGVHSLSGRWIPTKRPDRKIILEKPSSTRALSNRRVSSQQKRTVEEPEKEVKKSVKPAEKGQEQKIQKDTDDQPSANELGLGVHSLD